MLDREMLKTETVQAKPDIARVSPQNTARFLSAIAHGRSEGVTR
jgi:hypothetical protein